MVGVVPAVLILLEAGASTSRRSARTALEEFVRKRLADGSENLHDEAHRKLDRALLSLVMERTRGNQFQAARVFGVARQTLRRRLHELTITPRFTDGSEDDAE